MGFFSLFKDDNKKALEIYKRRVSEINSLEDKISALSDEELKSKTLEFKDKLSRGATLDIILPEAFAVVREASKRVSGERHYDVQLIGGMAIHDQNIAEMRTGEGKTLVATLPAYLNALEGKGVHLITVNDYLARRDAVWMGQIYSFLGLSVGILNDNNSYLYDPEHKEADKIRDEEGSYKVVYEFLRPVSRREAYAADITYGTNSQFGFDYLRDNIEYEENHLRQRGLNFAIVDEIDSVLIDEARTPLIISAPKMESENLYQLFSNIVKDFEQDVDYTVDEKKHAINLTDSGIEKAEKFLKVDNIYTEKGIKYVHHLENAVKAKALYHKDKEYVVKGSEVIIVDEFTGRLQPGRRWSEGIHQAIEAKEGLPVQKESQTFATVTYQNFFRMYDKLAGMTGTALTNSEEFFKVYNLGVVSIPTHREVLRKDYDDLIFRTEEGKFKALARKVKELNKKGQPVLIGTASVDTSERLSEFLDKEKIKHTILNAKNHESEGAIIANAGQKGAVTVATNMAGRGVDIKLGGVPFDRENYQEVKDLGGLYVIGTERHDARRIDNQLRGRSGRQGDPGETQFYVSLEDKLMRIFASGPVKAVMERLGLPEDQPIENKMITKSLENAQKKIEGLNFDARKKVLEFDIILNTQRLTVYKNRRELLTNYKDKISSILSGLVAIKPELENVIKEKEKSLGQENWYRLLRRMMLQITDKLWIDHLELMDFTRSSVALRGVGQRDPLTEYKKEGKILYDDMKERFNQLIIKNIESINVDLIKAEEEKMKRRMQEAQRSAGKEEGGKIINSPEQKIGRNDIVTITKDGQIKQMKYKKAEKLLSEGWEIKN